MAVAVGAAYRWRWIRGREERLKKEVRVSTFPTVDDEADFRSATTWTSSSSPSYSSESRRSGIDKSAITFHAIFHDYQIGSSDNDRVHTNTKANDIKTLFLFSSLFSRLLHDTWQWHNLISLISTLSISAFTLYMFHTKDWFVVLWFSFCFVCCAQQQ